jgi:hypothetical protein
MLLGEGDKLRLSPPLSVRDCLYMEDDMRSLFGELRHLIGEVQKVVGDQDVAQDRTSFRVLLQ